MLFFVQAAAAQDEPVRSIVNVKGDLYRFQQNNHYGVFLVTKEGIILADPLSHDNAVWLKAQLDERFGVPVKYVIYSHDHADHTSGGEVFADTAVFVSHFAAAPKIEASGHSPAPDKKFPKKYRLVLGKKMVALEFFTNSHSDNLITVIFPEEGAIFLVDAVAVKRLPYRTLRDYYFPDAIEYLQMVEEIKFDILIPGHGPMGGKQDVTDHRVYLETLMAAVEKARADGLSLEEAQETILLQDYKDWGQYEAWRKPNIEGMYRILEENENKEPQPKVTKSKAARYPSNAYSMGMEGWVVLNYDLNTDGKTENIQIVDSGAETTTRGITETGRALRMFQKQAIKALKNQEYETGISAKNLRYYAYYYLPKNQSDGGSSFVFGVEDYNGLDYYVPYMDWATWDARNKPEK